jgi:hypothetical protein
MIARLAGMDWEVCERLVGPTIRSTATIELKHGRICLTALAFEAAKKPEAFVVLYSRDNKSIGFKPAALRDDLAMMVSRDKRYRGGHRLSSSVLARQLREDGYTGVLHVPVQWHPDGLLWGDLTMATKRQRKAAKAKGVAG